MKALLLVSGAVLLLAMLVVVVAGEDEAWDTGSGAGTVNIASSTDSGLESAKRNNLLLTLRRGFGTLNYDSCDDVTDQGSLAQRL